MFPMDALEGSVVFVRQTSAQCKSSASWSRWLGYGDKVMF